MSKIVSELYFEAAKFLPFLLFSYFVVKLLSGYLSSTFELPEGPLVQVFEVSFRFRVYRAELQVIFEAYVESGQWNTSGGISYVWRPLEELVDEEEVPEQLQIED